MDQIMKPIFVEKFLPDDVINIVNSYVAMKFLNDDQEKYGSADGTNVMYSFYADTLMETLLDMSTPVVENLVKRKLYPSYSFLRMYDKGSDLEVHIDRDGAEYTVALALGEFPIGKPYTLYVGEEDSTSDYKYFRGKGDLQPLKITSKFNMVRNNAGIFQGRNVLHWREICTHDHFFTVFFHYVAQDGPLAKHKFDSRNMLGAKKAIKTFY
jgi:hypothetical protein